MKKSWVVAIAYFLISSSVANAVPQSINDDYIGGFDPASTIPGTYPQYDGVDVIGQDSLFDISSVDVEIAGDALSITIYSEFFDNTTNGEYDYGVGAGDVFLSTDGWNPTIPTENDIPENGEDWEIALTLSNNGEGVAGTVSAYNVIAGNIIESSSLAAPIFREGQEVRYDGSGQTAIATGTWEHAVDFSSLMINITLPGLSGVAELGVRWTETCANDVFEGAATGEVPEPGTLILLAAALGGALPVRKRALKN